jgi:hypothetical protein
MSKVENQLEVVRDRLANTTKQDWLGIAVEAKVDVRTVCNVADPKRKPGYDTVFRVYSAIKKLNPKRVTRAK